MVDAGSADGKRPNERAMSGSRREKDDSIANRSER